MPRGRAAACGHRICYGNLRARERGECICPAREPRAPRVPFRLLGAKPCTACGEVKPVSAFYTTLAGGRRYLRGPCKACHVARTTASRRARPRQRARRRAPEPGYREASISPADLRAIRRNVNRFMAERGFSSLFARDW